MLSLTRPRPFYCKCLGADFQGRTDMGGHVPPIFGQERTQYLLSPNICL